MNLGFPGHLLMGQLLMQLHFLLRMQSRFPSSPIFPISFLAKSSPLESLAKFQLTTQHDRCLLYTHVSLSLQKISEHVFSLLKSASHIAGNTDKVPSSFPHRLLFSASKHTNCPLHIFPAFLPSLPCLSGSSPECSSPGHAI